MTDTTVYCAKCGKPLLCTTEDAPVDPWYCAEDQTPTDTGSFIGGGSVLCGNSPSP